MMSNNSALTSAPIHCVLSNELNLPTSEAIANFKAWELSCVKKAKQDKIIKYVIHGIWIPLVIYLATLSYL